jgi:hypothetical protein
MSTEKPDDPKNEFLEAAGQQERGLIAEFVAFMAENKVWWLSPILIVFGVLAVLLVLGATGIGPFIYVMA